MRGNKVQGRFKIDFESASMDEGIVEELRDPVGTTEAYTAQLTDYQFRLLATICHLQGSGGRFKTSVAELGTTDWQNF